VISALLSVLLISTPSFAVGRKWMDWINKKVQEYSDRRDLAKYDQALLADLKRIDLNDPKDWCASTPDIEAKLGPKRDQKHRPWCYAETAADLATAATGKVISGADIAIHYDRKYGEDDACSKTRYGAGGGSEGVALRLMSETGFCEENDLPTPAFVDMDPEDFNRKMSMLSSYTAGVICTGSAERLLGQILPRAGESELHDLAKIVKEASPEEFLAKAANRRCEGRRVKIPGKIETVSFFSKMNLPGYRKMSMMGALNMLDKGQPVGVGLDMRPYLASGGLHGLLTDFFRHGTSCEERSYLREDLQSLFGAANHAMTMVGVNFDKNTGKCMAVLRNSWGGSCGRLNQRANCDPKTGNLQIPLDELKSNMLSLTYVDDAKDNPL
jgi:hypothetical protein